MNFKRIFNIEVLNIPKVKIEIKSLEEDADFVSAFLFPRKGEWDWSEMVYRNYPELKNGLQGTKSINQKKKKAREILKEIAIQDQGIIAKKQLEFQKEWDEINDQIMKTLSEIIEREWSSKDEFITARISLNPICPRFIKTRTFDIFYGKSLQEMKSVAIHEILHFIYFEKWKQVFPNTKEREFDDPYLVWKLSEMVPGVILNDKRIQEVFKWEFHSYQEFEEMKIEGKFLLEYLREFYKERADFEDFLKKSYQFVVRHQKIINGL